MRQLLYTFFFMATAALFSCGNNTLHGEHYDTTLVDTMLAMVPGGSDDSDATPLQWTYNADSTLATLTSRANHKSQITAQNKMTIQVRLRKGIGTQTFLVLRDGERFAVGNSDTANIVNVYSEGKMVGKYRHQPGPNNAPDTAFIYDKAFLFNLRASSTIKLEFETFTSGRMTYDFKCEKPLEWTKK